MKVTFNSPVVLSFAFISTLVYFSLLQFGIGQPFFYLPAEFNFDSVTWYISLFGYSVGHGSTEHLIGNMTFILLLGPILEEKYGSKNLIAMILSCVLITAIFNIFLFDTMLVGASGVVFMFIILVSLANFKSGEIPLTFILVVFLFVGNEVWQFFNQDGISHFAHIMGGLVGAVFGMRMSNKKKKSHV